jgi:ATP-binding cassette subfamily B protein
MYIKDGGIAEVGTHDELMKMKGLYYQLYWTQHAEETALQ